MAMSSKSYLQRELGQLKKTLEKTKELFLRAELNIEDSKHLIESLKKKKKLTGRQTVK
jgi:hypothetical protein